jgi:hypothetical protein
MREYIFEKVKDTTKFFSSGGVEIEIRDELPDGFNLQKLFSSIEKSIPPHFFKNLKRVRIEDLPEFESREINAIYKDNEFIISPDQDNSRDLADDIVHEFAHHVETLYTEEIYSDEKIKNEFLKKRQELKFEIQSEGYWVEDYDFDNLRYDEKFDVFLYKRIGRNMLRMMTGGLFIRPYSSISLREYFATGFEAYYLGKKNTLEKISPMLYDKIDELHNYSSY